MACLIGLPILLILGIVVVILLALVFGVSTGLLGKLVPWSSDTFLIVQRPEMATVGICLFLVIPLITLIYSVVSAVFKWKPISKWIKTGVFAAWIVSVILLAFSGWKSDWQQLENKNDWHFGIGDRNSVQGDGNITERTASFTLLIKELEMKGSLNVDLQIDSISGNSAGITVEGDSNIINEYLNINQNGEKLTLENKRNSNLRTTKPLVVKLQTVGLEKVNLTGATKLNLLKGLKNYRFSIEASGASNLKLDSLEIVDLKLDLRGTSKAELTGKVQSAYYNLRGASKISANNLISNKTKIDASGASHITCCATELTGKISGASKVIYSGEPKINNIKISGAGKIIKE
jgi:hypothetical protein